MADITIRSVTKSYGKIQTLHGIDLAMKNGSFVVILGPSGCGKSTLLRMIAGLEDISSGEILINDKVVNNLEPRERGCAMVFQNYALYPHMTVAENIGYGLKVAGVPKAVRRERVEKIAASLGLANFLDRRPSALSGGQRQRVAMGRAMIREPKVFLFDEPLSNLDAMLRVQMRVEIRKLHQRLKATSIFVTHDQVEAMTLADMLVVMNNGRVEQVGTPAEIYHQPASRFVGSFIGSPPMNFFEGKVLSGGKIGLDDTTALTITADVAVPTPGTPVSVGFRPEEVEIVPHGQAGAHTFTVDMVEELGSGRLVHGTFAGVNTILSITSHGELQQGQQISIRIPVESVYLFDAETGLRLGKNSAAVAA
ncbi:ABC transporter ATP-binding protein [Pseudochelatococcus sp. G4_1912]|uniref:ABC transporter ATP-binding protein n=1 Tax=Pseudochelatococcus sp. G4_1912 TaxID=3114288 RepID=UPI0039C604E7